MRSAVFCSFVMFVMDAINDHIVEAYSSIGLVTAMLRATLPFFSLHSVEEMTLRIGIYLEALTVVVSVFVVSLGSRARPTCWDLCACLA